MIDMICFKSIDNNVINLNEQVEIFMVELSPTWPSQKDTSHAEIAVSAFILIKFQDIPTCEAHHIPQYSIIHQDFEQQIGWSDISLLFHWVW